MTVMMVGKLAVLGLTAAAILTLGGCRSQERSPRMAVAFATPGTELKCKKNDPCQVEVKVRSAKPDEGDGKGCIASIDHEFIKVPKEKSFTFEAKNIDVGSTESYKFMSPGVIWDGSIPVPDEMKFIKLVSDTVSEWTTGKAKSKDLAFLPLVLRGSDGRVCDAIDPRIANDG